MSQRANLILGQTIKNELKLPDAIKRRETASGTSKLLALKSKETIQQTAATEKSRSLHHTACQRFLDRGNKPVPPNYEEQDVLPYI